MANKTFQTTCNQCGASINMVETSPSAWEAFDSSGKHFCHSASSGGWSLWSLGHPLTCTIACWWCGQQVYYHTNGNGDSVLFDKLGKPWPIHPCWEENRHEQLKMVRNFETDLIFNGYNGKDKKFSLIGKVSPYLTIEFKDHDHRILDKTIKVFCSIFNEHKVTYIGPLPLPTKNRRENMIHSRIIKIRKHLLNDVMQHMQTLDLPPSVQVEFKDI